jgi:hypothetical protein
MQVEKEKGKEIIKVKTGDKRFIGIKFPFWFDRKEIRLSSKILDLNQNLTPYEAMAVAANLCNSGKDAADEYLKADHIEIDKEMTNYPPRID